MATFLAILGFIWLCSRRLAGLLRWLERSRNGMTGAKASKKPSGKAPAAAAEEDDLVCLVIAKLKSIILSHQLES